MSILWERAAGSSHYQVRQAGRSLRLYTNGVLHSQYNPARPVTGNVWDLLFLPAFFYPAGGIRRILLLGVGGGAVIQQLRRFVQPERVVGVELNQIHLAVARRFFGVRGDDVELVRSNAVDWVRAYRGTAFDVIIDDLFADADGDPRRAVTADQEWVAGLTRCLSSDGMIVCNFASRPELMVSAYIAQPAVRGDFRSAFRFDTPQNHNAVGAFLRKTASPRQLRDRLRRIPEIDPRRPSSRLNYRIRTLY